MPDLAGEKPFYSGYTGGIDSAGAARIAASLNAARNDGFDSIHLAFSSHGGNVADGIFLYNHLRALNIPLHIYNTGSVSSIAVAVFLGADHRYCSKHGMFMIHPTSFFQLPECSTDRLRTLYEAALADDERTNSILRERTRLPDNFLDARRLSDVHITPDMALEHEVVHALTEFSVPKGIQVFQI